MGTGAWIAILRKVVREKLSKKMVEQTEERHKWAVPMWALEAYQAEGTIVCKGSNIEIFLQSS